MFDNPGTCFALFVAEEAREVPNEGGAMKEIDILLWANAGDFVVVEKETNRMWTSEEIQSARDASLFQEEDQVVAPGTLDVSGPFPGCLQMGAAAHGTGGYHAAGQTRNFVFFVPIGDDRPGVSSCAVPERRVRF